MSQPVFWRSLEPLRIIGVFRLVVAGLLFWAGEDMGLGGESRLAFLGITVAYMGSSLLLGSSDLLTRLGTKKLTTLQFMLDILVLTLIMAVSGGFRSGMPLLMMMYLAAAGVVSEGRIGLFLAALATLAVLAENLWRMIVDAGSLEFFQVGLTCAGFFAIAFTSHLLASRARRSEALAQERGKALGQQRAINELIIEDMNDGVVVVASDGTIRQANPSASELLGVVLNPGLRFEQVDRKFARLRQLIGESEGKVLPLGADQRELRCRVVLAGQRDEWGDDARDAIVYLTDQDEVRRQAQQLKLAALGRLVTSLAHEIRNPLSAIQQASDLLVDERDADKRDRLVGMIDRNGKRIERLVRDVLAAGRQSAYPETLALGVFVADIIDELCLPTPAQAAIFTMVIDQQHTIAFDRAHLHQVLGNLLTNARRHATGKPGSISIHSQQESSNTVSLHVIDDGDGIADIQQTHLFEPFLSNDPQGIGLGLYIARELAEINGAQLGFVGNEPGAHFVITGRSHT